MTQGSSFAVFAAALAACGGDSLATDASVGVDAGMDAGHIADVCAVVCDKYQQCDPSAAGCTNRCQATIQPLRDELQQAWAACTRATACQDLFVTTSSCSDGGTACGSSTVDTCMAAGLKQVPDSVLDSFETAVCGRLAACGVATDNAQCHASVAAVSSVVELKAFPDAGIACVAGCVQAKDCPTLSSTSLGVLVDDCAAKSCGLHLGG